jgi:uncharacterized protein YndB with AHSA1/START domain
MTVRVEKSLTIEAPPEAVFEYVAQPQNQLIAVPALVELRNVEVQPGGGFRCHYTYQWAGEQFKGVARTESVEPNARAELVLEGAIAGRIWTTLRPEDGRATRLSYGAAYEMPKTVVESVAEGVARSYNERQIDAALHNAKLALERRS